MTPFFIITCEHGGNRLPDAWRTLFASHGALLRSHEGRDRGALRLAREMATALGAEHHYSIISRLLVDLNRSVGHPENFSPMTQALDEIERQHILDTWYHPYRDSVERSVVAALTRGQQAVHVSCHSFASEVDGELREAEIGLLYDPVRVAEARICERWKQELQHRLPWADIRFNYPYLGVDDGLVTALRGRHPSPDYAGIELEVRNDVILRPEVRRALVQSLQQVFCDAPATEMKLPATAPAATAVR